MQRFGIYKRNWYCRWCGKPYKPDRENERDGFCHPKCRQALHRAYKKYTERRRAKRTTKQGDRSGRGHGPPKPITLNKGRKRRKSPPALAG